MDGMIDEDDESSNEGWKRWDELDTTNRDNEESENDDKERSEVFDDHEWPVCNIRKFEMIKYSFRDDKEYVTIKENEYDDLTNTSKEAIHAYQEIFRMMDEGWMDIAAKKSTMLVKYPQSRSVGFMKSQDAVQHTSLLINSTWRIYRAKYQESFSC
ncbi:hypothetical protein Tco_1455964 [Tanacetum coccineum]